MIFIMASTEILETPATYYGCRFFVHGGEMSILQGDKRTSPAICFIMLSKFLKVVLNKTKWYRIFISPMVHCSYQQLKG